MYFDIVIVGAGLAGCVAANILSQNKDNKILIIENRNHIGGNCYDEYDDNGILIHKYGPHIFHTNDSDVWNYLSRFTKWKLYNHKVTGLIQGQFVPIPFNLSSLDMLFPDDLRLKLEDKLLSKFSFGSKVTLKELKESDDDDLIKLSNFIYEHIFINYTIKQWNLNPEDLSEDVINRVPIYISYDNRYFTDQFQGMPIHGYTKMMDTMLDNNNIKVLLNTDYKEVIKDINYKQMIYTASIDYFFDYQFGQLKYRSLKFDFEYQNDDYKQKTATVNYPNNYDFTRITNFKMLTGQIVPGTITVKEYSCDHIPNENIPYYPILNNENTALLKKYEKASERVPDTFFVGRLAEYKYYNMDAVVKQTMEVIKKCEKK
ncbi:MAG: UDP-galactopyranose mutase [bacterium]|nr:UDP-galactopyranose mutase [bacterium]